MTANVRTWALVVAAIATLTACGDTPQPNLAPRMVMLKLASDSARADESAVAYHIAIDSAVSEQAKDAYLAAEKKARTVYVKRVESGQGPGIFLDGGARGAIREANAQRRYDAAMSKAQDAFDDAARVPKASLDHALNNAALRELKAAYAAAVSEAGAAADAAKREEAGAAADAARGEARAALDAARRKAAAAFEHDFTVKNADAAFQADMRGAKSRADIEKVRAAYYEATKEAKAAQANALEGAQEAYRKAMAAALAAYKDAAKPVNDAYNAAVSEAKAPYVAAYVATVRNWQATYAP